MATLVSPGVSLYVGGCEHGSPARTKEHVVEIDLDTLEPNEKRFINFILDSYDPDELQIQLLKKKSVSTGWSQTAGAFFPASKRLEVATRGKPVYLWISTLIHELCHFDQFKEQCKAWQATVLGADPYHIFSLWVDGVVELKPTILRQMTLASLHLELDCEKRALKKVRSYNKQYKLGIDVSRYAKQANAYVYFFHMVAQTRKWYMPQRGPYEQKAVWSEFPDHFNNDYSKLPTAYKKLYLEHCYKE